MTSIVGNVFVFSSDIISILECLSWVEMKFPDLIGQISTIDEFARLAAGRTLQQILSLRNWLIGASIVEFEQAGEDRAQYGQRLMHTLAQALGEAGCQGLSASN